MQRNFNKFFRMFFVIACIVTCTVNSARGSDLTQNAEKALAIMTIPVGLAANANIQNATAVSYIKLLDDVLVLGANGFSVYNKSINDSRDLSYFKVLDAAYRVRDIAAQVRSIRTPTGAQQVHNQEMLKTVGALSLSLVQSAARTYVAFNTADTEEQRKIRYWCDAVAFFANRLSDLTSHATLSTLSTEEYEYQLAGIATGLVLLLAYAPERMQVAVAVERAKDVLRAGRKVLEDGGRAGRKVLEDGRKVGRKLLKEGGEIADRTRGALKKGRRAVKGLYKKLAA